MGVKQIGNPESVFTDVLTQDSPKNATGTGVVVEDVGQTAYTVTGPHTFVVPANTNKISAVVVGGGGGSGGTGSNYGSGGGGGGGLSLSLIHI